MNILINAYACSPIKGSEPGMAWNWIIQLAKHCKLFVITEGEWKDDIEAYLEEHQLRTCIQFYYNPVSDKVRTMCWNQGDWRFYYYYRKWQKKTLTIANKIVAQESIDIIHQLNMVGYREPGLLWKIKNKPNVWGPIGGFGEIPKDYLSLYTKQSALKQSLKQLINRHQVKLPYIKKPIQGFDRLIACNSSAKIILDKISKKNTATISEVGAQTFKGVVKSKNFNSKVLKVAWVGKNDERKALNIALDVFKEINNYNIELHIFGVAQADLSSNYKNIIYHGWLAHDKTIQELQSCHLLLFTSLFEATGTAVLEAISYGLPVLCHNTCGMGDIIDDSCGYKIDMKGVHYSIQHFKLKIIELFENRDLLQSLSKGALSRVLDLSWETNAKSMVHIYKELSDTNTKP
ncbi:glycosyltransferase family 4 protein [Saccharicrinis aurantiacus]|uniref:glycosyltransferase family 4 protein n=1 Tax=Saccharicrinis aurantiacus TaxID=1849719 RepID=UPI0009F94A3B|nr:glycosyltransferase [Saccharicrinis aurantiacus]